MEKINNKGKLVLIGIFLILFISGLLVFKLKNSKVDSNKVVINNKYILLDDYSRFFTINSCVYKFVQYLQSQDMDSLLLVLDKKYVESNNITKDNIYNFLPNLTDAMYTFSTQKIYYKKGNSKVITYYVHGYIVEEIMDAVGKKTEYYFEVTLDTKNETFSIIPYDGKLFKEEA